MNFNSNESGPVSVSWYQRTDLTVQRKENSGAREARVLCEEVGRMRTLFSAQDWIICTTPLAMQRRSLRVRLRSTVRRLVLLVSAKTLGCDPADPLALAACLQTTVAPQHCGDFCTTSTCTSSIRSVVVLVSSKAAERSCPPRRSRSVLLARWALRTWRDAITQAAGRRRTSVSRAVTTMLGTSDSFTPSPKS